MKCPACNSDIDPADIRAEDLALSDSAQSRRMKRFAECQCGAVLALSAWEGWERWYLTGLRRTPDAEWQRGPEADAYYEREQFAVRRARAR